MGMRDNSKNAVCSNIKLEKSLSVEKHVLDELGIAKLEDGVVFVAGDRVITRSSATKPKAEIESIVKSFRLDIDINLLKEQAFEGVTKLICLTFLSFP